MVRKGERGCRGGERLSLTRCCSGRYPCLAGMPGAAIVNGNDGSILGVHTQRLFLREIEKATSDAESLIQNRLLPDLRRLSLRPLLRLRLLPPPLLHPPRSHRTSAVPQ